MLADGSKRSLATSMRMCNLKNATNDQCDSGRIDLEMFVASGTEELGMFDHLFKGDLVSLGYTTPSGLGEYARPKTGEVIYTQLLRIKRPVDVFSGYQLLAQIREEPALVAVSGDGHNSVLREQLLDQDRLGGLFTESQR